MSCLGLNGHLGVKFKVREILKKTGTSVHRNLNFYQIMNINDNIQKTIYTTFVYRGYFFGYYH